MLEARERVGALALAILDRADDRRHGSASRGDGLGQPADLLPESLGLTGEPPPTLRVVVRL